MNERLAKFYDYFDKRTNELLTDIKIILQSQARQKEAGNVPLYKYSFGCYFLVSDFSGNEQKTNFRKPELLPQNTFFDIEKFRVLAMPATFGAYTPGNDVLAVGLMVGSERVLNNVGWAYQWNELLVPTFYYDGTNTIAYYDKEIEVNSKIFRMPADGIRGTYKCASANSVSQIVWINITGNIYEVVG